MMGTARGRPAYAAALAVAAAFVWATYYVFVLSVRASPAAVIAYPFLAGGLAYLAWSARSGHVREFVAVWKDPHAYVRVALVLAMQLSVLAATYVAGPVDTSLLSLIGDVQLTPILLVLLYREGVDRATSPWFLSGLALSTIGASLTIVGGQSVEPIQGLAWLIAPAVPLSVALYFLLSAQANRTFPSSAIVGQAMLGGGLAGILVSPLLPGGAGGLWVPSLHDGVFLVLLGVTSFFLAPFLYFEAIKVEGILLPSLMMATIPLFTLAVTVAFLGASASTLGLLGIPIAVAGGLVAVRGAEPSRGGPPPDGVSAG